ncbi:hypothetical protein ACSQ6I_09770 [Anabaena sp. WFMT]
MNMQITEQNLPITNSTLSTLITELGEECQKVQTLINQLQLPGLTSDQKGDIIAELLVSVVHLHTHCDDDFQELISNELEELPDDEQKQNIKAFYC